MSDRRRDAGDLDRELKKLGIPIIGVILRMPRRGKRHVRSRAQAEVQYADEATAAQRVQGDAVAAAYDWDAPAVD